MDSKKLVVAFDVDGTLLDENGDPRDEVVGLLVLLAEFCDIVVWSAGGQQHAEEAGEELGLGDSVRYAAKNNQLHPDIAFDDQPDTIESGGIDKVVKV